MRLVKTQEEIINPSEGDYDGETSSDDGIECDDVADAIKQISRNGYVEGDARGWFYTIDAEINIHTGEHTHYSYFLSGFTDEELDQINAGIKR